MTDGTERDHGYYGPGSVVWRIVGHPAAVVGGMRALMVQALEPHAMAGVFSYSDFTARPLDRLQRTMAYVRTVTFGTTEQADTAIALVRRVHERVSGIDPVTDTPYSAMDSDTLIWVHLAEYHSYLVAYEAFAGSVSREDADEYFRATRRAVVALGATEDDVPTTRGEVSEYFAAMRPRLCLSERAKETIGFVRFPPITRELMPVQVPIRLASAAAVSLLPDYVRHLIGVDRPRVLDLPTRLAVLGAVQTLAVAFRLTGGVGGRGRGTVFMPHAVEHGFVEADDLVRPAV